MSHVTRLKETEWSVELHPDLTASDAGICVVFNAQGLDGSGVIIVFRTLDEEELDFMSHAMKLKIQVYGGISQLYNVWYQSFKVNQLR